MCVCVCVCVCASARARVLSAFPAYTHLSAYGHNYPGGAAPVQSTASTPYRALRTEVHRCTGHPVQLLPTPSFSERGPLTHLLAPWPNCPCRKCCQITLCRKGCQIAHCRKCCQIVPCRKRCHIAPCRNCWHS